MLQLRDGARVADRLALQGRGCSTDAVAQDRAERRATVLFDARVEVFEDRPQQLGGLHDLAGEQSLAAGGLSLENGDYDRGPQGHENANGARCDSRAAAASPAPGAVQRRFTPGRHGLAGRPKPQVAGQRPCRLISIQRQQRHRLQAYGVERAVDRGSNLSRRRKAAFLHGLQHGAGPFRLVRRLASQDGVKGRPQAVNVGARAQRA